MLAQTGHLTVTGHDAGMRGGFLLHASPVPATFLPSDLAGLVLWVRPESLSALSDGDLIATWPDESVEGNDFVQADGAKQPSYKTNILNGNASVRHTPTGPKILISPLSLTTGDWSLFVVAKYTNLLGTPGRILGGVNNWLLGWHNVGIGSAYWAGWVRLSGDAFDTDPRIYSGTFVDSSNQCDFYGNGSLLASNTFGSTGPDGVTSNGFGGGTEPSNSDVFEIVAYDSALSDLDREQVETYLNTKYGVF